MILRSLAVTLLLVSSVFGGQPAPALQGSWTAAAGPGQSFRGMWSAVVLPGTRNAGRGSWVLLNAANQVVLQGEWAAQKSGRGWQGTWSARILTGRPPARSPGRSFAGTWQTEITDAQDNTLAGMLQRTLEKQLAGSWRSGARAGTWSLKASQ